MPIRTRRFALRYGRAPSQREPRDSRRRRTSPRARARKARWTPGNCTRGWAGKLARSRASRSRRLRRRCGTPTPASPTRATRTSRKPCRTSWCSAARRSRRWHWRNGRKAQAAGRDFAGIGGPDLRPGRTPGRSEHRGAPAARLPREHPVRNRVLDMALDCVQCRWFVLPCQPGQKAPVTRHGCLDARSWNGSTATRRGSWPWSPAPRARRPRYRLPRPCGQWVPRPGTAVRGRPLGGLPLRSIKVVLSGPPESALTLN